MSFAPGKEGSDIKNPKVLDEAAKMIKVTPTQLGEAITFKTMGGGKLSTYKARLCRSGGGGCCCSGSGSGSDSRGTVPWLPR